MQKTILAATLAAALGMGGTAYAADLNGGSLKDAPAYVPADKLDRLLPRRWRRRWR